MKLKSRWTVYLIVGVILVVLGQVLGDFWVLISSEALIMVLFAISFLLLYGHTGLMSFGQGAFFGVGAYGVALAMTRLHAPFLICLLIGVAAAGVWAWLTGYLCVRLAGIYFAIMTVVVAQTTFYVIFQWYGFTNGDNGIQGLLPPEILRNPRNYYYFTLIIVSGAFVAFHRIVNSPLGLSLRCIRENMVRSASVGIGVRGHMHKAFILAGIYAGLSGALFAPFNRSVVPQLADWLTSGQAAFMGILGGPQHVLGPVVGAIVWVFLDAFVLGITVYWPLVIGIIVFFIIFFMPGGLMGTVNSYLAKSRAKNSMG